MIAINYRTDNVDKNVTFVFNNNNLILKWFKDNAGDLYWVLYANYLSKDHTYNFNVGIQDYKLYSIIEQIYNDFKDGEIYSQDSIDSELKFNSFSMNRSQYVRDSVREIYNSNTEEVSWDSDEDSKDHTNNLKIIKGKNKFILCFKDVIHGKLIRVCFKNNRSYYGPCSQPFFRAFKKIDEIKDNPNPTFEDYFNNIKPILDQEEKEKTYIK